MLLDAEEASILVAKLRDFVLNENHKDNKGRWQLFAALGYTQANWNQLAIDLRLQHLTQDAVEGRPNRVGRTYSITARLAGPTGSAQIKSIWQIDYGAEVPRFITAYGA